MSQRLLKKALVPLLLLFSLVSFAQEKVVTGKVLDKDGSPLAGVSITVKGSKSGTQTLADGSFKLNVPQNASTLTVSFVGYETQSVSIGSGNVAVTMNPQATNLSDVIVSVGYGGTRRKDLTGAVSTLSAKDFNKGVANSPDELMQGKIPGLQTTINSGQPGASATIKIRGNNSIRGGTTPLYVVDGVPLDGRAPRPALYTAPTSTGVSGLGNLPDANPLIYLNPNDIANMTVLQDAAACAIYGSRGANGVVLIETKHGTSEGTRLDVGATVGVGGLMKQADVLSASQYRQELAVYGAKSDSGQSLNPFHDILQHGASQAYNIGMSGGNDAGHYRASFLASNQNGILLKSALKKYVGNVNGQYRFLDKKLSLDFFLNYSNYTEFLAPISNDAGSTGNMVSAAMNWNPTLSLYEPNGSYNQVNPSGQINPLALSAYYDDQNNVSAILGNISVGYKILPNLEYKFLFGLNYGTGLRNNQLQGYISGTGGNAPNNGQAFVADAKLSSQTYDNTLTYTAKLNTNLTMTAIAGFEYWTTNYRNNCTYVYGFDYNIPNGPHYNFPYYNNMQDGNLANLKTITFVDPSVELQSYFGRVGFNWQDKYLITAIFRSDGSSKFGSNNKYANFPSVSARWNVLNEGFMQKNTLFSALDLRLGWGKTGSQDGIPAGATQTLGQYQSYGGNFGIINYANPNLRWETITSTDGGIDFGLLKGRLTGSLDAFFKKTTDPLFLGTLPVPSNGANIWQNLPGYITNKGIVLALNYAVIKNKDWEWDLGGNLEYVKNEFVYPAIGSSPLFLTGGVNGQGVSSAFCQAIANKQPIDVFYLRKFTGFDADGIAKVESQASGYAGDPNAHYVVGIYSSLFYKKFTLNLNFHGAYGYYIYNNTRTSVTNLGNITNGKNISKTLIGTQESLANPVSASTRFLESGNFMKLGNAQLVYNIGNIGKYVRGAVVNISANNLFEITKYHGFDAEVNVDHNNNGVPSLGIDYIGYPTARYISAGLNFSL